MNKICRIGTTKETGSTFVKIVFKDKKLSITGVEGPTIGGNARGGCGQIQPIGVNKFAKGWDQEKLNALNKIWNKYHLNDMNAECFHQKLLGQTWKTHPESKCEMCGWKLGCGWKKEEVPSEVLKLLEWLPDTDRQPNWV